MQIASEIKDEHKPLKTAPEFRKRGRGGVRQSKRLCSSKQAASFQGLVSTPALFL